jgi:hypothetical protein
MTPSKRELAIFAGAYLLYSAGRFVAIGDLDVAKHNAESILRLEDSPPDAAPRAPVGAGGLLWRSSPRATTS